MSGITSANFDGSDDLAYESTQLENISHGNEYGDWFAVLSLGTNTWPEANEYRDWSAAQSLGTNTWHEAISTSDLSYMGLNLGQDLHTFHPPGEATTSYMDEMGPDPYQVSFAAPPAHQRIGTDYMSPDIIAGMGSNPSQSFLPYSIAGQTLPPPLTQTLSLQRYAKSPILIPS